ncbi:MAG: prepilin-type N-terminal cleavage/methylation domain-containing protein [Phycisphaerae bacterium]|jgi:prepilin-type N-terminal cleavage/methylation domain-containing protein
MPGRKVTAKLCSAFTLVEVIVVILIVSILAGVAIPILNGKVDSAKWSEANSGAGTIRTAVTAYVAGYGVETAKGLLIDKKLDNADTQALLGFDKNDLKGTYFVPGDYTIANIDEFGRPTISVKSSQENAPGGEKTLAFDGTWE